MPDGAVRPGRKVELQVAPPSLERETPMSVAPPLKKRPTWKADTIVLPFENVSGSTSVACWLVGFWYGSALILLAGPFWNGSALIFVRGTFALAAAGSASSSAAIIGPTSLTAPLLTRPTLTARH